MKNRKNEIYVCVYVEDILNFVYKLKSHSICYLIFVFNYLHLLSFGKLVILTAHLTHSLY